MSADRIELLQGTLDLLILETLRWGPQHGYGLSQLIRTRSGDRLRVDTGSLYPACHRLERKGWVKSTWQVSDNKQRVKVYTITAAGRRQLSTERARWEDLTAAVAGVLNARMGEAEA